MKTGWLGSETVQPGKNRQVKGGAIACHMASLGAPSSGVLEDDIPHLARVYALPEWLLFLYWLIGEAAPADQQAAWHLALPKALPNSLKSDKVLSLILSEVCAEIPVLQDGMQLLKTRLGKTLAQEKIPASDLDALADQAQILRRDAASSEQIWAAESVEALCALKITPSSIEAISTAFRSFSLAIGGQARSDQRNQNMKDAREIAAKQAFYARLASIMLTALALNADL